MLTKEDLLAISELMDSKTAGSETRLKALIESTVMPKIALLAEGQQLILETLAPKSRVEALEEEVDFLKATVKLLAQKLNDLEKAG